MAATETYLLPLFFEAPDFFLPEPLTGKNRSLQELRGEQGTLVMFICNHCPYVIHVIEKVVELAREYEPKGIRCIAISSNDVEKYPDDAPEKMKEFAARYRFNFPYLYDETQEVAKKYFAACTPDFSLFDADLKCVYRGQLDGSRPKNEVEVTGTELRKAFENLLNGLPPVEPQIPSLGCNIKWKDGNSPW